MRTFRRQISLPPKHSTTDGNSYSSPALATGVDSHCGLMNASKTNAARPHYSKHVIPHLYVSGPNNVRANASTVEVFPVPGGP